MSDNTDNNTHNFDNDNQRDAFNDEHTRSFNDEKSSPEDRTEINRTAGGDNTNHIESDSGSSMINDSSQSISDMSHSDNEEDEESSAIEDVISDIKRDMQEHADDVQQGIEDDIHNAENDDLDNVFADDDYLSKEEDNNEEDDSNDTVDFSDPQSSREEDNSSHSKKDDSRNDSNSYPSSGKDSSSEEKPSLKNIEKPQKKGEKDEDEGNNILHQETNPSLSPFSGRKLPGNTTENNPEDKEDLEEGKNKNGEVKNPQDSSQKENSNNNEEDNLLKKDEDDKNNLSSSDDDSLDHKNRLKKKAAQNTDKNKNEKDGEKERKRNSPGNPFSLAQNLKDPKKGKNDKNPLKDEDNPFKVTKNAMKNMGKNGDKKGVAKKAAGAVGSAALGAAKNKLSGKGKTPTKPIKKGQKRDDSNKAEFLGEGVASRKKTSTHAFSLASGVAPHRENPNTDPRSSHSEESGESKETPTPEKPKKKKKGKKVLIAILAVLAVMLTPLFGTMASLTSFGPTIASNMQGDTPQCDPNDPESAGSSGGDGGPSLGDVGDSTIPAEGTYTSGFGARWGTQHKGVDIANEEGTPIYAAHDGTVISSGPATGYGLWVRIQSDKDPSFISIYGHQSKNHVKEGDKVKAGDHIADMSSNGQSTGSHLHFQVEKDGQAFDPVEWFDKEDLDFPELQGQVKLEKGGGGSKSSGSKSEDSKGEDSKSEDSKSGSKSGDNSSAHGDSKILIIGDSITEGSKDKIKENIPGAKIDSAVGRQYSEGLNILKKENDKYDTVVMALGTNGPFSQGDIDETIKAAGDAEVVLMTVKGPNVKAADSVNPLVKKNSSKVSIADWESIVDEHPDYIGGDGIHPTGEGQQAFADLLGDTVDGSGGSSDEEQNTNPVGCVCEAEGKGSTSNGGTPGEGEGATNGDVESRMEKYAPIVIGAGKELGMSDEDIITAIMTVQVESAGWQNWANDGSNISPGNPLKDDYTDEIGRSLEMDHDGIGHDEASVGLFQQQVSRTWGKVDDLMIPAYQAGRFYIEMKNKGLAGKKDNLGKNAQDVQISQYPDRYAAEESKSREIYSKYKGDAKLSGDEKKDAKRAWDDYSNGSKGSDGGGSSSSSDTKGPSGSGVCASNGSGGSSGDSEMDGVIDGSKAGDKAKKAAKIALKQIGKPYVWGAAGPDSFDCSGLITYAYKKAGLNSLIDSGGRFTTYNIPDFGKKVKSKEDIAVGDAIITNGGEHVMMYVGDGQIVEAQQTGVPVLKRPLSEINDIVSIHRFVDENDKELK